MFTHLIVGDIHIQGKNPVCRLDDLVETQFLKLHEIVQIANKYKTHIICVGDVFNSSVVANSILNKFSQILDGLEGNFYFVFGNHDLLYHSVDLWDRTSLGVLLQNNPKMKMAEEADFDMLNWGCGIVKAKKDNDILVSHKAIVSKNQIEKNHWIGIDKSFAMPISDRSLKQYKLIICGHWHTPYTFKYLNKVVINSGAITRSSIADTFHPSVTLLNDETYKTKVIPLKSAKGYEEVISSSHKVTSAISIDIKDFIKSIDFTNASDNSLFYDNLVDLLESGAIEEDVKSIIQDSLQKINSFRNRG